MIIKENYYDHDNRFITSTKFLLANGYYGYRGTLSEDESKDMVVWNLNGIYDQVEDNWRESINAFNPLFTYIRYHNQKLHPKKTKTKEHSLSLDLDTGLLSRKTIFLVDDVEIEVSAKRFADQIDKNLIHEEYSFRANKDITIGLYQGIDLDIYDISGKHLKDERYQYHNDILHAYGFTQEKNLRVDVMSMIKKDFFAPDKCICENNKILHHFTVELSAHKNYSINITAAVIHSIDKQEEILKSKLLTVHSFEESFSRNVAFWQKKWDVARIDIIGEEEANLALNYDIFQLIAHRPYDDTVSIPARGLSGQVYKGAVFWDTEIYMFLFYLLTDKEAAKNILKYRINGLEEAKKKAKSYNFQGAFYAWESQEEGFDACSDYNLTDPITKEPIRTYFKELQIHINSAIVYAMNQYIDYTKDYELLKNGGFNMLLEICRFYADYLTLNDKGQYECLNVIGPDEYHEHVDNNAYTNYLIKFSMERLDSYLKYFQENDIIYYEDTIKTHHDLLIKAKAIEKNILLPKPNQEGIIPQFDGYLELEDVKISDLLAKKQSENEYLGGKLGLATNTQVIKQADVILLLVLFPKIFSREIQRINYDYYKSRTEHGSSLSKAVYSILASRLGDTEETYNYFLTGANIDLTGKSKQYAGGIYIGGSHLAAYGGAFMAVVLGFLGFDNLNNSVKLNLPKEIKHIDFKLLKNI